MKRAHHDPCRASGGAEARARRTERSESQPSRHDLLASCPQKRLGECDSALLVDLGGHSPTAGRFTGERAKTHSIWRAVRGRAPPSPFATLPVLVAADKPSPVPSGDAGGGRPRPTDGSESQCEPDPSAR